MVRECLDVCVLIGRGSPEPLIDSCLCCCQWSGVVQLDILQSVHSDPNAWQEPWKKGPGPGWEAQARRHQPGLLHHVTLTARVCVQVCHLSYVTARLCSVSQRQGRHQQGGPGNPGVLQSQSKAGGVTWRVSSMNVLRSLCVWWLGLGSHACVCGSSSETCQWSCPSSWCIPNLWNHLHPAHSQVTSQSDGQWAQGAMRPSHTRWNTPTALLLISVENNVCMCVLQLSQRWILLLTPIW